MTAIRETNQWSMVGNGVTTDLPYDNKIFAATDMRVFQDGVELGKLAGYSVTGVGNKDGGNVAFDVAVADGVVAVARRDVPHLQSDDLVNNQAVDYELVETMFDRVTVLTQQNKAALEKSLRLAAGDPAATWSVAPLKTDLANAYWGGDVNGDLVPLAAPAGTTAVSVFMATVLTALDEAAARLLLGAGKAGFAVAPQVAPDMTVQVAAGSIFNPVTRLQVVKAAQNTGVIAAPGADPRYDVVYLDVLDATIGVQTGVEAASPAVPAIPAGKVPLALLGPLLTTTTQIDATLVADIRELAGTGQRKGGVAQDNVPVMDATGYPAADGRQITNVSVDNLTGEAKSAFTGAFLQYQHRENSGVAGGATAATTYNLRKLNTEVENDLGAGVAGLVSQLFYDAQTANFTVGQVVTGGTSGATALIVYDNDAGATGTLDVINIVGGPFVDNEPLSDPLGGAATSNIPSGVSLTSAVYLPAGTYYVEAFAMAHACGNGRLRLQDPRTPATLLRGMTGYANSTINQHMTGRFTIGAPGGFLLEQYSSAARATDGLGVAVGTGAPEIYADLKIWKIPA